MSPDTNRVVEEALRLSPESRAEIIEALVRSLDEGDRLEDGDRARLHEALRRSDDEFHAGKAVPAADVLDRLGKR